MHAKMITTILPTFNSAEVYNSSINYRSPLPIMSLWIFKKFTLTWVLRVAACVVMRLAFNYF